MDATRELETLLAETLLPGERVLWSGGPDPARFADADKPRWFANLWAGGVVMWCTAALEGVVRGKAPAWLLLAGLPFLAAAAWLKWGRSWFAASPDERVLYVVTDRRVIALERLRNGRRVDWLDIRALGEIDRTVRDDGSGTVTFRKAGFVLLPEGRVLDVETEVAIRESNVHVQFDGVRDARTVIELVEARWDRPQTPPPEPKEGEGPDVTGGRSARA